MMRRHVVNIFETDRLLFRHHIAADLEPYCEMESDPLYRFPQRVHPRAELERSFRESALPPKPMGLLATVFKPEGRYVGRCGLYPHRGDDGQIIPGEAVLAFYLARPYWGRGLATEAGRAFVKHGFDTLGLSRIVAGANVNNLASNRAIQKSGLIYTHSGGGENGGDRWHAYELRKNTEPPTTQKSN
jgi:[ribosomal protein S5]-alanine N-acetyltransferase